MSDWPPVYILFITFRRTQYAIQTLESLLSNLHYHNLHLHLCDDGSKMTDDGTNRSQIEVLTSLWPGPVTSHEMPTPWGQFNMGGNTNTGIQFAQDRGGDYLFLIQDDTILLDPLDLEPYVCILCEHQATGMIRFNYLAPGLSGTFIEYPASRLGQNYTFLRIIREWSIHNPWKTDTYIPAFQPSLVHRRFYDAYGLYPENLHPGLTECGLCGTYINHPDKEDAPQVLIPLDLWPRNVRWHHIQKRAHYYKELTGSDT